MDRPEEADSCCPAELLSGKLPSLLAHNSAHQPISTMLLLRQGLAAPEVQQPPLCQPPPALAATGLGNEAGDNQAGLVDMISF
uniref:Uncharacterized protein n=1 Tax=Sphaerodactylus townsendi TaxID=933632 RepID=A0ACB8G4W3_9SAUR